MYKKGKISALPEFDAAEYPDGEQAVAEFLAAIMEDGDAGLLAAALGDVAKARGMTDIANASGMTREALYKALRPAAHPRFETVARVCHALGLKLTLAPIHG